MSEFHWAIPGSWGWSLWWGARPCIRDEQGLAWDSRAKEGGCLNVFLGQQPPGPPTVWERQRHWETERETDKERERASTQALWPREQVQPLGPGAFGKSHTHMHSHRPRVCFRASDGDPGPVAGGVQSGAQEKCKFSPHPPQSKS